MKKIIFLIATAIITLIAFNSCGDKLDLDKTLKFSTLTVEQQKQSIEQSGLDFVNKMNGMKDTKGMIALQAFSAKTGSNLSFAPAVNQFQANLVKRNVKSLEVFEKQMRVTAATDDEIWGEWSWNSNIGEFEKTNELTNKAIMHFPATETSTTNNAELTITFEDSNVKIPDSDPVQYMPSKISVVLKVGGAIAMKADFTASYKADATPTKAKQTLEIDKYKWTAELTNNSEEVSAKYEVMYGTETLLKMELVAAGTMTADAFENSDGPQDVFTSGAVYFQIMNLACLGGIKDVIAFENERNGIENTNDRSYADKQVLVINKHLILYGYFVDKKQKFADVEFYVVEKTDVDTNYDGVINQYDVQYKFELRFVLSDGSKVDIQTFFESGFEDLLNKLTEYVSVK
ncbi:MAG: hypothetical protein GZ091_10535 [Paludibacter sp.]|nr:hypothetical protein [Paludibacter sp.]